MGYLLCLSEVAGYADSFASGSELVLAGNPVYVEIVDDQPGCMAEWVRVLAHYCMVGLGSRDFDKVDD